MTLTVNHVLSGTATIALTLPQLSGLPAILQGLVDGLRAEYKQADLTLEQKIMGVLDPLSQSVDAITAAAAAEKAEVQTKLDAVAVTITDLQTQIAALQAGAVTQADIDAVQAKLAQALTDVQNIFTPDVPTVPNP